MAMTPRGDHLLVLLSILVAALVSFFVAAVLMGFGRGEKDDAAGELSDAELSAHTKESA